MNLLWWVTSCSATAPKEPTSEGMNTGSVQAPENRNLPQKNYEPGPPGAETNVDRHIADAQAELARAEQIVGESISPKKKKAADPSAPPAPPKTDAEPLRLEPASREQCDTACSALASMRRSADYVCRLAGDADGRCTDARSRVRAAEARVEAAQCRCAGAGG